MRSKYTCGIRVATQVNHTHYQQNGSDIIYSELICKEVERDIAETTPCYSTLAGAAGDERPGAPHRHAEEGHPGQVRPAEGGADEAGGPHAPPRDGAVQGPAAAQVNPSLRLL